MPAPRASVISPLLVGRKAQLDALDELVSQTLKGTSRIACIAGEAGIGKSRLVGEIEALAATRGFRILRGRCFDQDRSLPYAPLLDLIRTYCATHTDAEIAATFGSHAVELVKLVPELADGFPPLVPSPSLAAEQEKRRRFMALTQFFSETAPVVVSLEDLHWSDDTTLEWLLYFARQLRAQPILVLLTYRSDEIQPTLNELLAAFERMPFVSEFALPRLTRADVNAMLLAIFNLSRPPRAEFLEALYTLTDGNPFFVEEILKSLIASGDIYYESGEWTRKPLREIHIPRSVRLAVQQRTKQLSPAARTLLPLAAVIGQRFSFSLLQTTSQHSESALLAELKELVAAQLAVEETEEYFRFRHALTRQAIDAELLGRERKQLHHQVAEAMVKEQARFSASERAFHFYQAGAWHAALEWSVQAGAQAKALFAHGEAIRDYERARECAATLGNTERVAAIDHVLGQIRYDRGEFPLALDTYQRALEKTTDKAARALIQADIGKLLALRADPNGLPYLYEALSALNPETHPKEVALVLTWLGRFHHYRGEYEAGQNYLEQARRLIEPLDDAETLVFVNGWTAGALMMSGRFRESIEYAQRVLTFGQTKNYLPAVVMGSLYLAQDAEYLGRWSELESYATLCVNNALQVEWRIYELWGNLELASAAFYRGELRRAERMAAECFELALELGDPRVRQRIISLQVLIATELGQEELAYRLGEPAVTASDEGIDVAFRCMTRLKLAQLAMQREDWKLARTLLDECAALLVTSNMVVTEMELGALRAEVYCAPGHGAQAQQMAEAALAQTRATGANKFELPAWYALGRVLAAQERLDKALDAFSHAVEMAERMESRLMLAHALFARGQVHRNRGEVAAARADWTRALELCKALEAKALCWRVHAALGTLAQSQRRIVQAEDEFASARAIVDELTAEMTDEAFRANLRARAARMLPVQAPATSRQTRSGEFGGLTERERQVAVLVSEGKSNRVIAEELFLSERTVTTHMSNILSKLGYTSRSQVAVWAKEMGLNK